MHSYNPNNSTPEIIFIMSSFDISYARNQASDKPDHRTEVARRKRMAMRSRILRATMQIYSSQPAPAPAIEDIITEAGISKGGFYRYFSSTSEAVQEIGYELADELAALIVPAYNILTDPLQRACIGTILVLRRAAGDPAWAGFMLRADLPAHDSQFLSFIQKDIRDGAKKGQFTVEDPILVSELVMGINQICMRGVASRPKEQQEDYIRFAVRFLLGSLGVSESEVNAVLTWSDEYFESLPVEERWWEKKATKDAKGRNQSRRS